MPRASAGRRAPDRLGATRCRTWAGTTSPPPIPARSAARCPAVCYFAHAYVAEPADAADVIATTELDGTPFPSAVGRGRVAAVQFHPERSGAAGRALLAAFLRAGRRCCVGGSSRASTCAAAGW